MNTGALIIGIGFFIIAILDSLGSQIHIRKEYREKNNVKEWQKKRVFADVLIGIGSMILYFSPQEPKTIFFVGVTILSAGFIILFLLDHKFKKV